VSSPIPPLGHILDVMSVWRKGSINVGLEEGESLCYSVVCCYNGAQCGTSSSYRLVDWIGLWSCFVQLSISRATLFLWPSWCCAYLNVFVTFFILPSSELSLVWLALNLQCCPRITWLSTVQQDLRQHHLTLPEAADLAQNRPLWRMMSTYGATQS